VFRDAWDSARLSSHTVVGGDGIAIRPERRKPAGGGKYPFCAQHDRWRRRAFKCASPLDQTETSTPSTLICGDAHDALRPYSSTLIRFTNKVASCYPRSKSSAHYCSSVLGDPNHRIVPILHPIQEASPFNVGCVV
jgi:hypothetical protein